MSFFSHSPGTGVAIRFLRDYAEFGCTAHLTTSQALKQAFDATSDPNRKKLLAVKNFSEMMNIIEDLAGLCISIKHRDEGGGLIFGFIMYNTNKPGAPITSVRQFFEAVKQNNSPVKLLGLPSLQELKRAKVELHPNLLEQVRGELINRGNLIAANHLTTSDLLEILYNELPKIFNSAAKTFFAEDEILVRAYNQTKHGFKVINDPKVFALKDAQNEEKCIIFVKNPAYVVGDKNSGKILEFSELDYRDFDKVLSNIFIFTGALKSISMLVAALLDIDLITSADNSA